MPRVAVEATLTAPFGPLRVTTTHLEYYSEAQRHAQVLRLRMLHDEACQRATMAAPTQGDSNATFKPSAQTTQAILVGDFNFPPENPAFEEIRRPLDGGGPAYRDAWALVHGNEPHPPTFCLFDRSYSKEAYCCDFAFVSADLAPRVRDIRANLETRDSDHQPLVVVLE
jgi:endonuclease/exonuclease/phosphatase family metal-dependent hydrolase